MTEDERLGVLLLVVVVNIGDGEVLLRDVGRSLGVGLEVAEGHEAISINALRLMEPKLSDLGHIVELLGRRHEETLERKMKQCEQEV